MSEQLKKMVNQDNFGEIISNLSALSEKYDTQMLKLQNDLQMDFHKEIQACVYKHLSIGSLEDNGWLLYFFQQNYVIIMFIYL